MQKKLQIESAIRHECLIHSSLSMRPHVSFAKQVHDFRRKSVLEGLHWNCLANFICVLTTTSHGTYPNL
jgi:hypothetical protein